MRRTQRDRSTPLYIADNGTAVRCVCMQSTRRAVPVGTIGSGDIATIVGGVNRGYSGDGGPATQAELNGP